MNENINNARRILDDNAGRIDPTTNPVAWNLHNALVALDKGVSEEIQRLEEIIRQIQRKK